MAGGRFVTGQAPVVGGNAAGARERALDDAIKQAVNQTLATIVDAQTRAAQAKTLKAIEAKARSFVPRYRTVEEGEANGVYTIRLEAEVDETALRRRIERGTTTAPPPTTAPVKAGAPGMLVAAGDKGEGTRGVRDQSGDGAVVGERARARGRARRDDAPPPPRRPRRARRWSRRRW